MKIQILSDLHLEANPDFQARAAREADVLVLAGDIGSYQIRRDGTCMAEADWGLRRFSPLAQHGGWPTPVLFVPGNHEYDALDFDQAHVGLRETCRRLGIGWLEREIVVLKGVRFVGCTLWSDYDALSSSPHEGSAAALLVREKAFRAANHYLRRMNTRRANALFDAQAMRVETLAAQAWLRRALSQPHDGPTVVVTHFAPSLRSADPRYGVSTGTAAFCNALDDLLPMADLWIHGHLHCPQDYQVGRCRVVANPMGYADKNEQAAFKADAVWEVVSDKV